MEEVDLVRQLVELAVTAGRSHQSAQTSFVHYCHEKRDEGVNHTIPIYENLLFALALMRMQTAANIQEAKILFSRVLEFQNSETGNFPRYLHEYPECRDRYSSVHVLAPIYWALKGFRKVLGKELIEKINDSMKRVLDYLNLPDNLDRAPFQLAVKIAAGNVAFGKMWNDSDLVKKGEEVLGELCRQSEAEDFGTWYSPIYIAETLIALQMVYSNISESPWKKFWTYLAETWHQPARCYCGPAVKTLQWRSEPQPTLYDLYLGDFTEGLPYHSLIDHPFQLQGALVREVEDKLEAVKIPFVKHGEVAGHRWSLVKTGSHAYSVIETKGTLPPELKKGFHHFRMIWGDRNRIHSFVCQGDRVTGMSYEILDDGIDLEFLLAEDTEFDRREKSHELCFYVNQHEGLDIAVGGKKATAFNLRDEIHFRSPQKHFSLKLTLVDGDGRFMGHIQPGNRPSQIDLIGENRFAAFDRQVFLRTVRRYTACRIKAEIRFTHED
jgi:hypothetical protein